MIYSYNGILLSTKKDRTTDTYMIESLKYNFCMNYFYHNSKELLGSILAFYGLITAKM